MRRDLLRWLTLATLVAGCGPPSQPPTVAVVGPHQGRLLPLPDGLGSVEVVAETRASSPRTAPPEVVAYFLGPDSRTPLAPPPTDVAVQVYLAEAKALEKVPLKPDATAGPARFAAVPPPGFDGIIKSGRVSARLAGRDVELPF